MNNACWDAPHQKKSVVETSDGATPAQGRYQPSGVTVGRDPLLRDVAQSGSALDWGSRGRRFKSCHPDQFFF